MWADLAVVGRIMRSPWMIAACLGPAIVALVLGWEAFAVAWAVGFLTVDVYAVMEHRRRRRSVFAQPVDAPINARVVMIDGRVIPLELVKVGVEDGITVWENPNPVYGRPRNLLIERLPGRTEVRVNVESPA